MMKLLVFLFLLSAGVAIQAQAKKPVPPNIPVPYSKSLQAVVVTTPDWTSFKGTARVFQRKSTTSKWKAVGGEFAVVVGKNGLAWGAGLQEVPSGIEKASQKAEGDGKAPAGIFSLTESFGVGMKPEKTNLPFTQLGEYTECVDDAKSNHYNKIVDRMKVGNFDWKSSEKMLAVGAEYELGILVGHNIYPISRGAGSCIFLHIWKDASTGTAGCTAMEKTRLETIANWIDAARNPVLIQLTTESYKDLKSKWNLPKL